MQNQLVFHNLMKTAQSNEPNDKKANTKRNVILIFVFSCYYNKMRHWVLFPGMRREGDRDSKLMPYLVLMPLLSFFCVFCERDQQYKKVQPYLLTPSLARFLKTGYFRQNR